ncbi:MAG TPA: MdtA/MuxA family multidrug efflux RND transporter periplasmic adaptor subunit [Casimicrobiaceae bacterium]
MPVAPEKSTPDPPPRGGRRALVVIVAVVVVALGIAWYYFADPRSATDTAAQGQAPTPSGAGGRRGGGDASRPTPVAAAAVRSGDFDVYLNALGTVTARGTVTVRSRVDGQLNRVLFNEGQVVKAGQLLAEIDPRPFEVQLEQMNGQMAKDQALLANARVDLERYQTLLAQDSIAKQQVDTQVSLVRQYEATIASDKGQVDNAKLQLSFTKIAAPISGRLGLRQVDAGNMIHANDTNGLVVITQVQPIDVVFPIPEMNLPRVQRRLREGDPPAVDAYDRNQTRKLATGKLITIDNQIDTTTGTIKLKAAFGNDDSALFPNQFVNVKMLLDTLQGATIVPTAAVLRGAPGTFVYLVKPDNTVTVRTVKLGPIEGENAVVDSGLTPGDVVVVDGTDRLREGAKIEPIDRNAQAAADPTTQRQRPAGASEGGRKGKDGKGAEAAK